MFLLINFLLLFFPSLQIELSKIFIIFFSLEGDTYNIGNVTKGNTEIIVDYIQELYGIKSYKIIPSKKYPQTLDDLLAEGIKEKYSNDLPEIQNKLENITDYDIILLGYPIWHLDLPNIVKTQLVALDFEGKTIYPFATHHNSGLGNSINQIKKYAPKAIVEEGFFLTGVEVRGTDFIDSHEKIKRWINNIIESKKTDSNYIQISIFLLLFILLLF